MALFISAVGGQDPFGKGNTDEDRLGPALSTLFDSRGGLLSRNLPIDRIILFWFADKSGKETMESKASQTLEEIERRLRHVETQVVEVDADPSDPASCDSGILDKIRELQIGGADEIHIGIASGAFGIQAALYSLTMWGFLPKTRLWRSLNPSYIADGDRIVEVDWQRHRMEILRDRVVTSLSAFDFAGAARQAHAFSYKAPPGERQKVAEAVQHLAQALIRIDDADVEAARTELSAAAACLKEVEQGHELLKRIDELEKLLPEDINNADSQLSLVLCLYGALSRRHAQKEFENVSTRARNIFERTLVAVLSKAQDEGLCQFDAIGEPGGIGALRNTLNQLGGGLLTWCTQLGESRVDIADIRNRNGNIFRARHQSFPNELNLIDVMNLGQEVHFGRPRLNEAASAEIMKCVREMLNLATGAEVPNSRDAPFGRSQIEQLAKSVDEVFRAM
jgi:hypothetical protein